MTLYFTFLAISITPGLLYIEFKTMDGRCSVWFN